MDEQKQQPIQIREGAGLDEARVNQDMVDFLKKYSTPILFVICGVVLAYAGLNYLRTKRAEALERAFAHLSEAAQTGSPDSLLAVAQEHSGQRAVPTLARLEAADIHLRAARTGVAVGAQLNADGTPAAPEDVLTAEQRGQQIDQAAALYQRVVDDSHGTDANLTAISGMFGLAAVAEMRGDTGAAEQWYTRIADRARGAQLPVLESLANERRASVASVSNPPTLYSSSQLPASAVPPAPTGMNPILGTDSQGNPIELKPMAAPPPGVTAPGQAAPTPADPTPAPQPVPAPPVQPTDPKDDIPLAPGGG
jgi:hypothetical protein